ncbi:hypothetical protein QOZ80_7BG0584660 [Eleusine coracana subsp. coracana]|nr:hypothetical protein QOZ80_7BG0584660 [Eleusine coracana subsp. coracana]
MEKLVEEALLRVPPDEPAHLVCAALACKPWGELISSHRFHHRFREFHGAPPVLSIIHHNRSDTLFKPTSSLYPPYAIDRAECHALDARHGRVLFCGLDLIVMDLIVMNLITGEEQKLPKPQLPQPPLTWAAALLCTAPGCNHLDCPSGSPFTVVAVATDISLEFTSATFYSSKIVVAVADDANVIFIDTSHDNGVFAINLKLGQGTKIGVLDTTLGIVPYESFYTPGSIFS